MKKLIIILLSLFSVSSFAKMVCFPSEQNKDLDIVVDYFEITKDIHSRSYELTVVGKIKNSKKAQFSESYGFSSAPVIEYGIEQEVHRAGWDLGEHWALITIGKKGIWGKVTIEQDFLFFVSCRFID